MDLVKYDAACRAIAEAKGVDEIVMIRDKAQAITAAARIAKNHGMEIDAAEIRIRAERRLGEMIAEQKRTVGLNKGGWTERKRKSCGADVEPQDSPPLAVVGIDKKLSSRSQSIAAIPQRDFEETLAEHREAQKAVTSQTMKKLADLQTRKTDYQEGRQKTEVAPAIVRANAVDWLTGCGQCDLLLTDPPYMTDVDDVRTFAATWLPLALSRVKPTGKAYIFIGAYPEELAAYLSTAMPTQVLVWTYRNTLGPCAKTRYNLNWQAILYYCGPNAPELRGDCLTERWAVQDVNAPDGRLGDRIHKWQKPDILAERIIEQATEPGATVFDPFCGSGTFLLAAGRLGRRGYGCDVEWSK